METRVARLESDIEYIKRDISDIKSDLREFKHETVTEFKILRNEIKEIRDSQRTDFRWVIGGGTAGFVLLASMLIAGYFRLESAIQTFTK